MSNPLENIMRKKKPNDKIVLDFINQYFLDNLKNTPFESFCEKSCNLLLNIFQNNISQDILIMNENNTYSDAAIINLEIFKPDYKLAKNMVGALLSYYIDYRVLKRRLDRVTNKNSDIPIENTIKNPLENILRYLQSGILTTPNNVEKILSACLTDEEKTKLNFQKITEILIEKDVMQLIGNYYEGLSKTRPTKTRKKIFYFMSDNWDILSDAQKNLLRNAYYDKIQKYLHDDKFKESWKNNCDIKSAAHWPQLDGLIVSLYDEIKGVFENEKKEDEESSIKDTDTRVGKIIAHLMNRMYMVFLPSFAKEVITPRAIIARVRRSKNLSS